MRDTVRDHLPSVRPTLKSFVINLEPGVREGVAGAESRNLMASSSRVCREHLFAKCPSLAAQLQCLKNRTRGKDKIQPWEGPDFGFVRLDLGHRRQLQNVW